MANSTFNPQFIEKNRKISKKDYTWQETFIGNITTSTIPYGLRHHWDGKERAPYIPQGDTRFGANHTSEEFLKLNLSQQRDFDLIANQSSLSGAFGLSGCLVIILSIVLKVKSSFISKNNLHKIPKEIEGLFWPLFFIIGIPLNILASKDFSIAGVAHLNLYPFICLAIVFCLRWIKFLSFKIRVLLGILVILDACISTFAQLKLLFQIVPILKEEGNKLIIFGEIKINPNHVENFLLKLNKDLIFWSDRLGENATNVSYIFLFLGLVIFTFGVLNISSNKN